MVKVDEETFREMVEDALATIPDALGGEMENVAVFVEDEHPEDPHLLGLYEGIPLTERGVTTYFGVMPDRITLYRLALCRSARSIDDLRQEVRATLLHEVAHYFGIDDEHLQRIDRY